MTKSVKYECCSLKGEDLDGSYAIAEGEVMVSTKGVTSIGLEKKDLFFKNRSHRERFCGEKIEETESDENKQGERKELLPLLVRARLVQVDLSDEKQLIGVISKPQLKYFRDEFGPRIIFPGINDAKNGSISIVGKFILKYKYIGFKSILLRNQ